MSAVPICKSSQTFDTLTPKQCKKVELRMKPGKWSKIGFIKKGESAKSVFEKDRLFLEKHNVSYSDIVAKLNEVYRIYITEENKNQEFEFGYTEKKGVMSCPFLQKNGENCVHSKIKWDMLVVRRATREALTFSSLLPHLIQEHHFFEGGAYRVDPEKACRFFRLIPMA